MGRFSVPDIRCNAIGQGRFERAEIEDEDEEEDESEQGGAKKSNKAIDSGGLVVCY